MFKQLESIIPGFELDPKKPMKILMEDCNACGGEFIIYSLLELYLRENTKVAFVASQHFYPHYLSVMKKMGINLQTSIDSGDLLYIDAFSQPFSHNSFDNLPISTKIPSTHTMQLPKNLVKFSGGNSLDFIDLIS